MIKIDDVVKIPTLKCTKCGHTWYPRAPRLPKVCPECKRFDWNKKMAADECKPLTVNNNLLALNQ